MGRPVLLSSMDGRFERQLRGTDPGFRAVLAGIPLDSRPPAPPEWLRCEMLERHAVLGRAPLRNGMTVVEVGSGPHAIATVPLAFAVGANGTVVACERSRWGRFSEIVRSSGLGGRIRPVACDARRLPLRSEGADLSVCLHGLRSLQGETNTVDVLREMLRISPQVFLAESLPQARTEAQRAHLAMYDLREEMFIATTGRADDLHYPTLDRVASCVERAGGIVEQMQVLDVDLPHALAYFPRELLDAVPSGEQRQSLLERWDRADAQGRRHGTDHPPVGIVRARRR